MFVLLLPPFDLSLWLFMLPPCHFLLYSSNIIVTLTEETNRLNHSDTYRLIQLAKQTRLLRSSIRSITERLGLSDGYQQLVLDIKV